MKVSEHFSAIMHGVVYTLIVELILIGFKKMYDKSKAPVTEIQSGAKIINVVNNPDGTVTYYYEGGGVVIETTNKK